MVVRAEVEINPEVLPQLKGQEVEKLVVIVVAVVPADREKEKQRGRGEDAQERIVCQTKSALMFLIQTKSMDAFLSDGAGLHNVFVDMPALVVSRHDDRYLAFV